MRVYNDPESGEPHFARHGLSLEDVAEVLARPLESRPGREGALTALGRTQAGKYTRDRPEHSQGSAAALGEKKMSQQSSLPDGWDEARIRRVLEYYEGQPDEAAAAEDDAAAEATDVLMRVPAELVPTVRRLIEEHKRSA